MMRMCQQAASKTFLLLRRSFQANEMEELPSASLTPDYCDPALVCLPPVMFPCP